MAESPWLCRLSGGTCTASTHDLFAFAIVSGRHAALYHSQRNRAEASKIAAAEGRHSMKRRRFLTSTLIAGGAAMLPEASAAAATSQGAQQILALKTYRLKAGKEQLLETHIEQALVPALNRLGVKAIGAYREQLPQPGPAVYYVVAPYDSAEQWLTVSSKLDGDSEYQRAGASYLAAQAADPIYERIETSLLRAFETMPKVQKPSGKPQVYNLRIYESHNEAAGQKKIEMFNQGEIAIFRRVGLNPVFFGEAIAGPRMPNLTYMLAFENDKARTDAWNTFRADPAWLKLRAVPEYEDKRIVSGIRNILLSPLSCSQI
jgi:hypothetical protein